MPFIELQPKPKGLPPTGVRLSAGPRGLTVTLAGSALEALGDLGEEARVRVLFDTDPALPRLRIQRDDTALFPLAPQTGRGAGSTSRLLRLPWPPSVAVQELSKLDCTWDPLGHNGGLDVDLPREFRRVVTTERLAGTPSTSGNARRTPVSLAKTGASAR